MVEVTIKYNNDREYMDTRNSLVNNYNIIKRGIIHRIDEDQYTFKIKLELERKRIS